LRRWPRFGIGRRLGGRFRARLRARSRRFVRGRVGDLDESLGFCADHEGGGVFGRNLRRDFDREFGWNSE